MDKSDLSFMKKATKHYHKFMKIKGEASSNLNDLKRKINSNFKRNKLIGKSTR